MGSEQSVIWREKVSPPTLETEGEETYRVENMTSSRDSKGEYHTPGTAVHPPTDRD